MKKNCAFYPYCKFLTEKYQVPIDFECYNCQRKLCYEHSYYVPNEMGRVICQCILCREDQYLNSNHLELKKKFLKKEDE